MYQFLRSNEKLLEDLDTRSGFHISRRAEDWHYKREKQERGGSPRPHHLWSWRPFLLLLSVSGQQWKVNWLRVQRWAHSNKGHHTSEATWWRNDLLSKVSSWLAIDVYIEEKHRSLGLWPHLHRESEPWPQCADWNGPLERRKAREMRWHLLLPAQARRRHHPSVPKHLLKQNNQRGARLRAGGSSTKEQSRRLFSQDHLWTWRNKRPADCGYWRSVVFRALH